MTDQIQRVTPAMQIPPGTSDEIADAVRALYDEGTVGKKGAFTTAWAGRMREDIDAAFEDALARPDGAVGRGPERYYVEIHPEQLRGWVELVQHPWVQGVCEAVLGPGYLFVELGFDVPGPGAKYQPWHRDFPMPEETRTTGRLTSLAFNLTGVDTEEDMGPFEIAPTTQWDLPVGFEHEMFPDESLYPRYERLAVRKYPTRGDISARSALTIHRGTENRSQKSRPVLVLGVDAPGSGNVEHHDMALTKDFHAQLPDDLKRHLSCPIVDELTPITQKHSIEGLMMGEA